MNLESQSEKLPQSVERASTLVPDHTLSSNSLFGSKETDHHKTDALLGSVTFFDSSENKIALATGDKKSLTENVAENAFGKAEQLVHKNPLSLLSAQAGDVGTAQNNIKYEVESYVNNSVLSEANRARVAESFNVNHRGDTFDKNGHSINMRAEIGKDGKFKLNFGGED